MEKKNNMYFCLHCKFEFKEKKEHSPNTSVKCHKCHNVSDVVKNNHPLVSILG